MKARELAEILLQNPDADVVMNFRDPDNGESFAYFVGSVSEGWLPSGVISLESGEFATG